MGGDELLGLMGSSLLGALGWIVLIGGHMLILALYLIIGALSLIFLYITFAVLFPGAKIPSFSFKSSASPKPPAKAYKKHRKFPR